MTRTFAAVVLALLVACTPASAGGIVRNTHKVSVEGELVDRWTINDPKECGLVGDGTLTVTFKTIAPARVLPFIDPFARSETGRSGSWIIGIPLPPHVIRDLRSIKATGTITRVDNTTRRPRADGDPCGPVEKTGCGTLPLRFHGRAALAIPERYDRRRIGVRLGTDPFEVTRKPCSQGYLTDWNDFRLTGGDRESGALRLTMPRESALKRRRVVKVTGSDHKRTTTTDRLQPGSEVITDDVSRKATVTFKKL